MKVRTEIEKHLKSNTEENEITDALKTIVANANSNDNAPETEQLKEEDANAAPVTQLKNGNVEATASVSS